MDNTIFCKICNEDSNLTLHSFLTQHLRIIHNISLKDYYNKYLKKENEGICKCGKETSFTNFKTGYRQYCSTKCVATDKNIQDARHKTSIERYGSKTFNNPDKRRETFKSKYGVDNISQLQDIKDRKIKTCLSNFGVDSPLKNESIKKKVRDTMFDRYGYFSALQILEFQNKRQTTCLEKYGKSSYSQTEKFRLEQEIKGNWVEQDKIDEYTKYYRKVNNYTNKYKKELLKNWNGRCYYTDELLINDRKLYNQDNYRTIDHKISIFKGFVENIDYKIIGGIDNLCICSRRINLIKNRMTEEEFKINKK